MNRDVTNKSRAAVGAIRWDAWTGGEITAQVERSLGPEKYHGRLPWFAQLRPDGGARIDGSPMEIMDLEIGYAADAGLSYWAFLLYPEDSSMSKALGNYLASPRRSRINFCVILHNSFGVPEDEWPRELERSVDLMKQPCYQTVLGGRPLVYAFEVWYRGEFPQQRFNQFLEKAREAGINPYCVFMGWNPAEDYPKAAAMGFDAVSAYAYASADASYSDLCRSVEKHYWQNAAAAGVPYVPLATTGWDKQPRKENPVSWELDHDYHRQAVFPSTATPEEISDHLKKAIDFVADHRGIYQANAIILYSWNEHDEGGWLVPTWTERGEDKSRLDAIASLLNAR